jgi:hypothetical protein
MIGLLVNNKLESIYKEILLLSFEKLSPQLPVEDGKFKENHIQDIGSVGRGLHTGPFGEEKHED